MSRVAVAYHESGHALAAWSAGVPVHVVSIRPREDRSGCTLMDADHSDEAKAAAVFAAGATAAEGCQGAVVRRRWLR